MLKSAYITDSAMSARRFQGPHSSAVALILVLFSQLRESTLFEHGDARLYLCPACALPWHMLGKYHRIYTEFLSIFECLARL